jgi:hypothetical protein
MMQKSAREEMFFNLEQYTPAVAVATNMNCSVAHLTNRINFPKSNQTARYAQQTTENILKSLFDGTNILTRLFLTRDNLTRDFISDFLRIISPHTIRPVSRSQKAIQFQFLTPHPRSRSICSSPLKKKPFKSWSTCI